MRTTLFTGGVLAVAGATVVLISSWFGLELESAALLGLAVGAVLALVPDRSPGLRAAAFVGGVVLAWIGYFVRAALLPDTDGGRAVVVALVVLLCTGLVAATMQRISLWMPLLGAAALVGAYEAAYAADPTQVASSSLTAVTTILVTAAAGFLAASAMAEPGAAASGGTRRADTPDDTTRLDSLMENSR